MTKLPQVILASASPRRQELLKYLFPEFEVLPSGAPEDASGHPAGQVVTLALRKARDVAQHNPGALVIGADTLVAISAPGTSRDRVLGKPQDETEAAAMLRLLSDRTHRVYTGVAALFGGLERTEYCMTRVTFAPLSDDEIAGYIATREPMDKAGAYGIQGFGAKFIRKVNGCYFNVMGLPLRTLYTMLKEMGLL
jgi:septum formation protein